MEVSGSVAAKILLPLARAVSDTVAQLRAERAAARAPFRLQTSLLDQALKNTLGRFLGGGVDDKWWRYVLAEMEQGFVAPDFFKTLPVQSWLEETEVQGDIVSLARANVMGQLADGEDETRKRLSESYSRHTGESEPFAKDPINVAVASLTAGYIASIPKSERSVAGMVQAVYGRLEGIDRKLDQALERDALVQSEHAKVAEEELSIILTHRMVDFEDALERVDALWNRVNGGDLTAVPEKVKGRVQYWTARLRASTFNAVDDARSVRQGLSYGYTDENLQVLDALIMAADGDADGAFQMLSSLW